MIRDRKLELRCSEREGQAAECARQAVCNHALAPCMLRLASRGLPLCSLTETRYGWRISRTCAGVLGRPATPFGRPLPPARLLFGSSLGTLAAGGPMVASSHCRSVGAPASPSPLPPAAAPTAAKPVLAAAAPLAGGAANGAAPLAAARRRSAAAAAACCAAERDCGEARPGTGVPLPPTAAASGAVAARSAAGPSALGALPGVRGCGDEVHSSSCIASSEIQTGSSAAAPS